MRGIARLFTQTVTVARKIGTSGTGERFAAAVTRKGFVNDGIKLVRDSTGTEVVSQSRVYGPLADVDVYTPGSKVTVNGRESRVIAVLRRDSAGPADAYHVEVHLT